MYCFTVPGPTEPAACDERSATKSPTARSRLFATVPGIATPKFPPPPLPIEARSNVSVVLATAHPLFSPPITMSRCTRASVMNTSLNIARPVISRNGRTSTPGWCMLSAKNVIP
uniref:Unannotated protein n=1 Tax=freshwater metagenome TaxID=449393 RepID=A0A6J7PY10_9ZZZZ